MTDLFIADISEFQSNVDFTQLRTATDAVIARVSYGTRLDKIMPARRDAIRSANFTVVGWYHFLKANQSINQQFNTFCSVIDHIDPNEFVIIDWETDGTLPTKDEMEQLATSFDVRFNRPTVIYGPASLLRQQPTNRLQWCASYQTGEPSIPHILWQYTNGRYTSGVYKPINWPSIGYCDTSVFHGSAQDLLQAVGGQPSKPTVIDIGDIGMAQEIQFNIHLGDNGRGYYDVQAPRIIGAPALNASDPAGPKGVYPPGIILSRLYVDNVTRVVAVNGNPNTDIGVAVTVP